MALRLGVIGSPISHSLTPRLQRAALDYLGLQGTSETVEVRGDDSELSRALASFDALSVTMPLKEVALRHCAVLDPVAQRIGAVNSIIRRESGIEGRSTDGAGLLDALEHQYRFAAAGSTCVVRGSGGAAKAVVDALAFAGATKIALLARNETTARVIADKYANVVTNPSEVRAIDLVVNTIPFSETAEATEPLTADLNYHDEAIFVDIIYDPRESPWLLHHRHLHRRTQNGLLMLVHQARYQLEWWLDASIPIEVLFDAVNI